MRLKRPKAKTVLLLLLALFIAGVSVGAFIRHQVGPYCELTVTELSVKDGTGNVRLSYRERTTMGTWVGERTVSLGPTEYRMLEFFMTHPERVYTRDQLLDRIWGGNVYVEERTIDVHIRRLRKALEDFGYDRFVQTVRGSGYRFSARTI